MILIIDNYDSFTHNLYQCIAPFHANIQIIRHDKITVSEVHALRPDAIILSPGPKRPEDAGICIELIKSIKNGNAIKPIPLLGVCLGHQAIGVAFGGKVIQAPEIIHGKTDLVFHTKNSENSSEKNIYKNMPEPFTAGRYHSLIIERETLPHDLIIQAENKNGLIMGVKHINLPIYGVQFHPESIMTPKGSCLLQNFVNISNNIKNKK